MGWIRFPFNLAMHGTPLVKETSSFSDFYLRSSASSAVKEPMKQKNIEPQITQMGADAEGKEWVGFGFLSTWPCMVRRWSKKPAHFLISICGHLRHLQSKTL